MSKRYVPPLAKGTKVVATDTAELVPEGTLGKITWHHPWPEMPYRVKWQREQEPSVYFGMSDIGDLTRPDELQPVTPAEHRIQDGRAVCLGDRASKCHVYPACECEYWGVDEETGEHEHPDASHDDCWVLPWINDAGMEESASDDALDCRDEETLEFPDGRITWEWEGEYVVWSYDDEAVSS